MFWGRREQEQGEAASQQSGKSRLEVNEPTPATPTHLSPELQKLLDDDDFFDLLYDGQSQDTTETNFRYAAYANRIRTLMLSAQRYVAYSSEIGESFRPVAHPYLIRSAYGISWAYILGDVAHEGYKAFQRNKHVLAPPSEAYRKAAAYAASANDTTLTSTPATQAQAAGAEAWSDKDEARDSLIPWTTKRIPIREDYRTVMAERAVFQVLASMALPAFTIHYVVRYAGRALKGQRNTIIRTWGPVGLGLAIVPFLPYIYDKPVETAVDWTFQKGLLAFAGEAAISPTTGTAAVDNSLHALHELKQKQNMKRAGLEEISWDEYKAEKNREREERKRLREERRVKGVRES